MRVAVTLRHSQNPKDPSPPRLTSENVTTAENVRRYRPPATGYELEGGTPADVSPTRDLSIHGDQRGQIADVSFSEEHRDECVHGRSLGSIS